MARIEARSVLRGSIVALCALWVAWTIDGEFLEADPDDFGFKSPEVEAEMKHCVGTFSQRYLCKEAIIIAKQHDSFLAWMQSVLLVLGPPVAAAALLTRIRPRRPVSDEMPWAGRPPQPISRFRVR